MIVTVSCSKMHLQPASHSSEIDSRERSIAGNTCAIHAHCGMCGRNNNFVAIDFMVLLLAQVTSMGWCGISSPGYWAVMKWPVAAVSGWRILLLLVTVCSASCFLFLDGSKLVLMLT